MARRPPDPTPRPPRLRYRNRHLRDLAASASLAAAALVLLAGCGDDGPPDPATAGGTAPSEAAVGTATSAGTTPPTASAPTTTPPATEPTTEPTTEEQAILAAVDGYWQSFFAANQPPSPDHPDLARFRTGAALEIAVANVQERQTLNQYVRLPEGSRFRSDVTIVEGSDDMVTVQDCVVDDSELVQAPSDVLLDSELETTLFAMQLVRVEEQWKVAEATVAGQWEGEHACAA